MARCVFQDEDTPSSILGNLVAVAAKGEEPLRPSANSSTVLQESTTEQSVDRSGLATVQAPVVAEELSSTTPPVSDIKPVIKLDPAVLQGVQEESVKVPAQRRPVVREAIRSRAPA